MRISRIYQNAQFSEGLEYLLDQRASHYLKNVLRIKLDAPLILFNGVGGEYKATVIGIEKKSVMVKLGNFHSDNRASLFPIHLVQSIARGEKMDWVLQKAVELGVSDITPVFSERSEVRLKGERLRKRMEHWQGVIVSACEQSGLNLLPRLHEVKTLSDWLSNPAEGNLYMLHPGAKPLANADIENSTSATLLIGPEGGFNDNECEQAKQQGVRAYSLGPRVLRTETAGIAAITLMQFLRGDFT